MIFGKGGMGLNFTSGSVPGGAAGNVYGDFPMSVEVDHRHG